VLIERVEELTPKHRWQGAYEEINDFETHMANHGVVIIKFWLEIDPEEQLRRFEARQNEPAKQHKITSADWRNREMRPQYETAVDEMLSRTYTPHAPWVIVESNNKKYARIKVIKTVADTLSEALQS
jgi:polyphosphate kinase 2 (PPK2 family)